MNLIPNEREAGDIYDILVESCGARDDAIEKGAFVQAVVGPNFTEWRFQGTLGFGGKFWNNAGKWYVSCYPEDQTSAMKQTIVEANVALATLRATAWASFQALLDRSQSR